jgi:MerR family transcriptional regulator, heat shock protein HspR
VNGEGCFVIGVVSRLVNMHPQTLRHYERLGLIRPSRTEGRVRLFSMEDVARLHRIQQLQEEGVNPAGIRRVLELEAEVAALRAQLSRPAADRAAASS